MRIIIPGGAGFIGSHLVKRFIPEHQVIVIDDFSTGRLENLAPYIDQNNFSYHNADISKGLPFFLADRIYNMACPASPKHYQADPLQTIRTNVYGLFNLAWEARACQARLLQASTSEVYGEALVHPQPETYYGNVSITGPRACYDEGKRIAEVILSTSSVDFRIARIFNTYGPAMSEYDGRVIPNFITQALRGEDITVYGDGNQTRSFCYIDDMIEGLVTLMESDFRGPVNLGNPEEVTILELAETIKEVTDSSSKIVFLPLPKNDPPRRRPDIALAGEKLGWKPTVSLKDGLAETIPYYKKGLIHAPTQRHGYHPSRDHQ